MKPSFTGISEALRRLPGRWAHGPGFALTLALVLFLALVTASALSAQQQGAAPPRAADSVAADTARAEDVPVAADAAEGATVAGASAEVADAAAAKTAPVAGTAAEGATVAAASTEVADAAAAKTAPVAGAAVPQGWAFELSHEIMSPFCPGLALSECPSPQAAELRDWIIEQERLGLSRSDVEAQLFLQYGDQLLQAPRPEGFGLLAYALPAAGLLIGFALMARTLAGVRRRRAGAVAPPASQGAGVDPEIERLLNAEIDN